MPKLIPLDDRQKIIQSTRFNDNDFPYYGNLDKLYARAAQGIQVCRSKKVIFCGLCRDVEENIEQNIQYLDVIGQYFKSYLILLYESDSQDSTVDKLYELSETYPIIFKSENLGLPRYTNDERERTRILSYCRNWYVEYILNSALVADYTVVVDCDSNGWSLPGFFTTFSYYDWDMMGANGIQNGEYYDTFPLRITGWDDYYFRGVENRQAKVARHLSFTREEEIKPVLSCFGGLGIYRHEAFISGYYGEFDGSEHVYFHRLMVDEGYDKLFINPQLLLLR